MARSSRSKNTSQWTAIRATVDVERYRTEQMQIVIRKAARQDAIAAWDIRNAAILAQCQRHYPDEQLAIWTSGEMTDHFVQSVAADW